MKGTTAASLLLVAMFFPTYASALDACAFKDGIAILVIPEPIDVMGTFFPLDPEERDEKIADEFQQLFRDKVDFDSPSGIVIKFKTKIGNTISPQFSLPDPPNDYYRGQVSIKKHVLIRLGRLSENDPDPSPCDPSKNATNTLILNLTSQMMLNLIAAIHATGEYPSNPYYYNMLNLLTFAVLGWSPLVIDVDGDGFNLGEPGVGVDFDMDANGTLETLQWVRPGEDEVLLMYDRNGNGVVDDGSELFGIGTPMELEGVNAENGFAALAQYDLPELGGNGDGWITAGDSIWNDLGYWLDLNADGVSTSDEIFDITQSGLNHLPLNPRKSRRRDAAGNHFALWAWAYGVDRSHKRRVVDVFFKGIN